MPPAKPNTFYHTKKDPLLDSDGLSEVPREVNVQILSNREPVGDELQRNDVEETLENVDGLGDLNLLASLVRESLITLIADNNGTTAAGNDCNCVSSVTNN